MVEPPSYVVAACLIGKGHCWDAVHGAPSRVKCRRGTFFFCSFLNYLQDCSRGWQEGGCLCTCLLAISTPLIANMDHVTYASIFHEIEFRSIHSILYVTTSSEVQPRSCQHSTNEAAHYRLNVALVGRPLVVGGWTVQSSQLVASQFLELIYRLAVRHLHHKSCVGDRLCTRTTSSRMVARVSMDAAAVCRLYRLLVRVCVLCGSGGGEGQFIFRTATNRAAARDTVNVFGRRAVEPGLYIRRCWSR